MTRDVIAELEALDPANPFVTAQYFAAREQRGFEVWVAGIRHFGSGLRVGCGLFFKQGIVNLELEIVSLPSVGADSVFWPGLIQLCKRRAVTQLTIESFGSPDGTKIPVLAESEGRRDRHEFVLDLRGDLDEMLDAGHRSAIARARGMDLTITRKRSLEALREHLAILNQPQIDRGESPEYPTRLSDKIALLESGAGELVQVSHNGGVLASALVLLASAGAFYKNGGARASVAATDAEHLLVHEIARGLRERGCTTFSLGGATPGSKPAQFRSGFGATPFHLQSMVCDVGRGWKRKTSQAFALARSAPTLLQTLLERS